MAAAMYYDGKREGLGDDFLDETLAALRRLETWPRSGPLTLGGYRRCLLRRFPYALVYRAVGAGIVVVALTHHKRRPGYWLRRALREDR